jgi:hypothetical protein
MDTDCAALVGSCPAASAKISNDLFTLPGHDGRSATARRYRDVVRGMLRDLGRDQHELPNAAKLQVRIAASTAVQIEHAQAHALHGQPVDQFNLIRMQNTLSRMLWALGLGKRRRQDLGQPDLAGYLAADKRVSR